MTEPAKRIWIDGDLHAQIIDIAENMNVAPRRLVEEAVVYYLSACREQIKERIQERLDAMFAKVDAATTYTVLPPPREALNAQ